MSIINPEQKPGTDRLKLQRTIINSNLFLFGGDLRANGAAGSAFSEPELPIYREYSYDDPDYTPGHGPAYTVHVDREGGDWTIEDGPHLEGPALPPDFVRNPEQRVDRLGSFAVGTTELL